MTLLFSCVPLLFKPVLHQDYHRVRHEEQAKAAAAAAAAAVAAAAAAACAASCRQWFAATSLSRD